MFVPLLLVSLGERQGDGFLRGDSGQALGTDREQLTLVPVGRGHGTEVCASLPLCLSHCGTHFGHHHYS